MLDYLSNDLKFLQGVGEKRALLFALHLSIRTFRDFLYLFPFRYVDRTKFYKISQIENENSSYIQIKAKLRSIREIGVGRKKRLSVTFFDDSGLIEAVWFNKVEWVKKSLIPNNEYVVFGKPQWFNSVVSFAHPDIENITCRPNSPRAIIYGVYPSSEKLLKANINTKLISQLQATLLGMCREHIVETLPQWFIDEYRLMPLGKALINIHFPQSGENLKQAQYRLKFEELFLIQLSLLRQKSIRIHKSSGFIFPHLGEYFNTYYEKFMPFELTDAQKRVLKEIRRDTRSGKQMNRLLQGDVGSGKTIVAFISMLFAIDSGFQCAIMAPTEILATQHYNQLSVQCELLGIECGLLTGSTPKKKRREIEQSLSCGSMKMLIGTHALIEDNVNFMNLGYVVIDEQHRFGVKQRQRLMNKGSGSPHILVMSATPIPRTLAMTLYGDLDISVIDQLPPNRKPITTLHYTDSRREALFGFMRREVAKGRQVYVVYPLIKESEKMDFKNLEEGYEAISRAFPLPDYSIAIVHGKMKPQDKDYEMQQFVDGKRDIMVATTVIEVGVNVPNASVMVIESAERFGLSQLHQLRGRVGRGAEQSYCVLMSGDKLSSDSRKRLSAMVETNDGFELAEMDLNLRGYGDLEGTQQSGNMIELKIASLSKDIHILEAAREAAQKLLESDGELLNSQNEIFLATMSSLRKDIGDYSSIL